MAWDESWAWSLRVVGNLIADEVRRRRRERRDPGASVDELVAKDPRGHATHDTGRGAALVADLMTKLKVPECETLQLLAAGVHSNEAIAALRGRRLRAVQESRRKIREAAAALGNPCRVLHPRTFVPV